MSRTGRASFRDIAPGVWCLGPTGRTQTNVYIVAAGSSWSLIDAGWAGDAASISAAGARLFDPWRGPASILLTHVHPDHGRTRDSGRTPRVRGPRVPQVSSELPPARGL